ncbi:NfeD family protein [Thiohalorhabdus sp. Cl-TMA]|uniref:NfeD family protein n=1 Tax=Thiohalorhabdus methylotrophus TaxID=3242694 RepID=A0ABV4TUS6_9GAMM
MSRHRLLQTMVGLAALEGATAGAAALLWGPWGLLGALAVLLVVGDWPFGWLLERHVPARLGREALPGTRARVVASFRPGESRQAARGRIHVHGALWAARLDPGTESLPRHGEYVRVRAVEGLTLVVSPESESGAAGRSVED